MAAFMFRLAEHEGLSSAAGYTPPTTASFMDVPTTHMFYKEISWLAEQGATTGWVDGRFQPRTNTSREAIAAFMYRYARLDGRSTLPGPTAAPAFIDVSSSHTFRTEITWLAAKGIPTGYDAPTAASISRRRAKPPA